MPIMGDIGDRLDLDIRKGATFGPVEVELQNPDGTEVDITGCTFQSFVSKPEVNSPLIIQADVEIISLKPAKFTFGFSAASTDVLTCGEYYKDADSLYKWGFKMIDSLGRVLPLFYGQISVWQEI